MGWWRVALWRGAWRVACAWGGVRAVAVVVCAEPLHCNGVVQYQPTVDDWVLLVGVRNVAQLCGVGGLCSPGDAAEHNTQNTTHRTHTAIATGLVGVDDPTSNPHGRAPGVVLRFRGSQLVMRLKPEKSVMFYSVLYRAYYFVLCRVNSSPRFVVVLSWFVVGLLTAC